MSANTQRAGRLGAIVDEFELVLADPAVRVDLGRKELHRNNAPPRVIFIPIGGPIEMTKEIGRQDLTVGTASRQLNQRNLSCELHCWGESIEQAEQIMHNAIATMHAAVLGSYLPSGERWLSDEELKAGDVNLGAVVVLDVVIQIPVMAGTQALVRPSSITHVGEFALQFTSYGMPGLLFGGGQKYGGNPENVC